MENLIYLVPGIITYSVYKFLIPGKKNISLTRDIEKLLVITAISVLIFALLLVAISEEINFDTIDLFQGFLETVSLSELLIVSLLTILTSVIVLLLVEWFRKVINPAYVREEELLTRLVKEHTRQNPNSIIACLKKCLSMRRKAKFKYPIEIRNLDDESIVYFKGQPYIIFQTEMDNEFVGYTKDKKNVMFDNYIPDHEYINFEKKLKIIFYSRKKGD